jgi:hypothetical protein
MNVKWRAKVWIAPVECGRRADIPRKTRRPTAAHMETVRIVWLAVCVASGTERLLT